jgi:hypothetical protein
MNRKARAALGAADDQQQEWLVSISTECASERRHSRQQQADTAREQLAWVSSIARPDWRTRAPGPVDEKLREFVEAITNRDGMVVREATWDSAKHPRRGGPPNAGWFVPAGGGGSAAAVNSSDPSRWYLPSDDKGTWISGKKGEGIFRLRTPVDVNGKLVHDIEYINKRGPCAGQVRAARKDSDNRSNWGSKHRPPKCQGNMEEAQSRKGLAAKYHIPPRPFACH